MPTKKNYEYRDNFESKYEEYNKKYEEHNRNNEEANDSFGQYGKIKRKNKTKDSNPNYLETQNVREPEKKTFETYMKNYAQYESRCGSIESGS